MSSSSSSPCHYSVHCLSSGSESTEPSLILQVERSQKICQKYVLWAVGQGRLAVDQKVALHFVRACFLSGRQQHSLGSGLPGLLLTLHQAGVEQLTVVAPASNAPSLDETVDRLANNILGPHRRHPNLQCCQVPIATNTTDQKECWYQVYHDEFILVHGHVSCNDEESSWLVTLLQAKAKEGSGEKETIAFLAKPPSEQFIQQMPITPSCVVFLRPPATTTGSGDDAEMTTTTTTATATTDEGISLKGCQLISVAPKQGIDGALFMRSLHQTKRLHGIFPFCFPLDTIDPSSLPLSVLHHAPASSSSSSLGTCETLVLLDEGDDAKKRWKVQCDQRTLIQTKCPKYRDLQQHENLATAERPAVVLEQIWKNGDSSPDTYDDNEIDLDDDDDDVNTANEIPLQVPHLVILGTGCATPSAHRASSGYALMCPSSTPSVSTTSLDSSSNNLELTALLDCGEGTLHQLHRHGCLSTSDGVSSLRWIWISHSHLDHYGGLPQIFMARRIQQQQQQQLSVSEHHRTKRQKRRQDELIILIAPPKVLDFLSILGFRQDTGDYMGVTHKDFMVSQSQRVVHIRNIVMGRDSSIQALINIPVHHCRDAHAVVMELRGGFALTYSGDTRPCPLLWQQARGVNLLVHEATFLNIDAHQAIKKNHSTISEALDVARSMQAKMVLLTHFSNRNSHDACPLSDEQRSAAIAHDGMWIPLVDKAVQKLPLLSQAIQEALSYCEKQEAD